jgi:hypothetical protein
METYYPLNLGAKRLNFSRNWLATKAQKIVVILPCFALAITTQIKRIVLFYG